MGQCLKADYKPPVVKRPGGDYCLRQVSTKEVVEAVRSSAFASPSSPLGLHGVFVCSLIRSNPG